MADLLRAKTARTRGSIDFDFPESQGYPGYTGTSGGYQTVRRQIQRRRSSKILCWRANETVAAGLFLAGTAVLYTVPTIAPDPEKIQALAVRLSAISDTMDP